LISDLWVLFEDLKSLKFGKLLENYH